MKLQDRVAIIACEGNDIDKAISNEFASEGATVVVVTNSLKTSEEILENITPNEVKAIALETDISDEKQVQEMVARVIDDFGKIDILVTDSHIHHARANLNTRFNVVETPLSDWNHVLAVNLTGNMLCSREVLKTMIPRKSGNIIHISSMAGISGTLNNGAYSVSQWGIIGLAATLAIEFGEYNIRVNSITGSGVKSKGFENITTENGRKWGYSYEEMLERITHNYSLKRLVEASEMAKTALFLASDDAGAITGQNISVNCGFHLIHPNMIFR